MALSVLSAIVRLKTLFVKVVDYRSSTIILLSKNLKRVLKAIKVMAVKIPLLSRTRLNNFLLAKEVL